MCLVVWSTNAIIYSNTGVQVHMWTNSILKATALLDMARVYTLAVYRTGRSQFISASKHWPPSYLYRTRTVGRQEARATICRSIRGLCSIAMKCQKQGCWQLPAAAKDEQIRAPGDGFTWSRNSSIYLDKRRQHQQHARREESGIFDSLSPFVFFLLPLASPLPFSLLPCLPPIAVSRQLPVI